MTGAVEILWTALAALVISVLSGVLTAGIVMTIGGVGVLRALHRRLVLTEERIEDVDTRITSEVKKRAAGVALEAKSKAKSAQQEVDEALGAGSAAGAALAVERSRKRPSVITGLTKKG